MADMHPLAQAMAGMTPDQAMKATQTGIGALQKRRDQAIQQQRVDISQQNIETQREELARRKVKDVFSRSMQKREMALAAQAQQLEGMLNKARMYKNEALERQAYEEAKKLKLQRDNLLNMRDNFQRKILTNTGEKMTLMEMVTLNDQYGANVKPADQEVLGEYAMPETGEKKFMLADPTSERGYRIVSEPELAGAERAADQKVEQMSVSEKTKQRGLGKTQAEMQTGEWADKKIEDIKKNNPMLSVKLESGKPSDKRPALVELKKSLETQVASTNGLPASKVELKEGPDGGGFYNTGTGKYIAAPPSDMRTELINLGTQTEESPFGENVFTYEGGKLK